MKQSLLGPNGPALRRTLSGLHVLLAIALASAPCMLCAQTLGMPPGPSDLLTTRTSDDQLQVKQERFISEVLEPELVLQVDPTRSKIVRTRLPITRISITDPAVVEVNEFNTREIEVIGLRSGETTLTLWFEGANGDTGVLRYLVRVSAVDAEQRQAQLEYAELQTRINEMFPNSQVQLIPMANKLIVRGQARDAKEATDILGLLGRTYGRPYDRNGNRGYLQPGAPTLRGAPSEPVANDVSIVNLLRVPGEQQVMLKVRIAEMSRSAARELGMDFNIMKKNFSLSNFIGGAGNITAILDSGDVELFIKAFASHGYGKILAEPTLLTLSGRTATFLAGGEFAVPTAVGIDGIGAASTTFRGFGTQLAFTPTVVDKDKIRLDVTPSFSTLNQDNSVDGIPGLDIRTASTTVDLRAGQWLAIAGLIQSEQIGNRTELPYLGRIPIVGAAFGDQKVKSGETELVILVSPELVHPLEADQVPLYLPGMEVTDPTDGAFYWQQRIEGNPYLEHRSTLWPQQRRQLRYNTKDVKRAARRGIGVDPGLCNSVDYYVAGPNGFSD
jgi:pilus assembly protein CpaC